MFARGWPGHGHGREFPTSPARYGTVDILLELFEAGAHSLRFSYVEDAIPHQTSDVTGPRRGRPGGIEAPRVTTG